MIRGIANQRTATPASPTRNGMMAITSGTRATTPNTMPTPIATCFTVFVPPEFVRDVTDYAGIRLYNATCRVALLTSTSPPLAVEFDADNRLLRETSIEVSCSRIRNCRRRKGNRLSLQSLHDSFTLIPVGGSVKAWRLDSRIVRTLMKKNRVATTVFAAFFSLSGILVCSTLRGAPFQNLDFEETNGVQTGIPDWVVPHGIDYLYNSTFAGEGSVTLFTSASASLGSFVIQGEQSVLMIYDPIGSSPPSGGAITQVGDVPPKDRPKNNFGIC